MTLSETINQFLHHPNHLPKNLIWRFPQSKSNQKHIFIFGAPRSGTTLVKLICGAHPHLNGTGYETGIFMYKDIFSFAFEGFTHNEMDLIRSNSTDIVDFFDKFSAENLKKNGGKRFIEKTPPHVLRIDFLLKYFPNSQFINVFRDGRDCYCSARHHQNVMQGKNLQKYAKYWRRCVQARLKQGEKLNIFDVKYEELVTEPEKVVKKMMAFLQEDYDEKQLISDYYSQNKINKSNRKEFKKLSKPIDKASINRYQLELSEQEKKDFEKIAGKELNLLGYSSNI